MFIVHTSSGDVYKWFNHKEIPDIDPTIVTSVGASGAERAYIKTLFLVETFPSTVPSQFVCLIPMTTLEEVRWYGDLARIIFAALRTASQMSKSGGRYVCRNNG